MHSNKVIKLEFNRHNKGVIMSRLKSLKIKNYKHIGDSYIGFDKLENLNILVGQNNIGKSTLLQSIEMIISENPINRDTLSETTIEFAFCPDENEIKNVFNETSIVSMINSNHFAFGKKYIGRYMSFEYKARRAIGEEQIKLSNIAGTSKEEFDINTRIEKFTELLYSLYYVEKSLIFNTFIEKLLLEEGNKGKTVKIYGIID